MTFSGVVTFTSQADMDFDTLLSFDNCSIDMRDVSADVLICGNIPIVKLNGNITIKGTFDELTMSGNKVEALYNNEDFSCSGNMTINMVAEDFPKTGEMCGADVDTITRYLEELEEPASEQEFCEA